MHNDITPLHIFDGSKVTSERYCIKILLDNVRLLRGAVGPDFLFMKVNARQHRTTLMHDTLAREGIQHVK